MEKILYTPEQIESKIKEILVEKLGQDESELTSETNLVNDLGLDSLDLVELFLYVEKDYNIAVEDAEIEGVRTIAEAVGVVKKVLDQEVERKQNKN